MVRMPSIAFTVLLFLLATPIAAAHDAPGSTNYAMPIPPGPYTGQITFVTLVGPAAGAEILHTTWNVTFSSGPGGTPASDVLFELTVPLETGFVEQLVSGADLGWPSSTGTFEGTLSTDLLNGVLVGGLFPFSTPSLDFGATTGGLTGKFIDSAVNFELAAGDVCQTDLGFGGPGELQISVCGQELATGNTALLELSGGPSSSIAFLVLGLTNAPTPFYAGTLVPVPFVLIQAVPTNALGVFSVNLAGGGGPGSAYLQALALDGTVAGGIAISNALQIDVLP
jgi:hypothetical protein